MNIAELHPLVVHFPIALLIVAVLFDLAALLLKREDLSSGALYLQGIAALGAIAAVLTGNEAEEPVEHLAGIEPILERHEDLGKILMWAVIAVVALRLVLTLKKKMDHQGARALAAVLSLGLAALVGVTGFFGGKLVYEYGAGVAPVMQQAPAEKGEKGTHEAPKTKDDDDHETH